MTTVDTPTLRALLRGDLERVVEIDSLLAGRSRRGFLDKRLAAAEAESDAYIALAVDGDERLDGFAIARLQSGEFGDQRPVVILDAIGVEPDRQGHGLGRMLMGGLDEGMARLGVIEMRTQVDWTYRPLIGFFAAAGFTLAPRLALERPAGDDIDAPNAGGHGADPDIAQGRLDADIPDYSDPDGDDFVALSRDRIPVRSMAEGDLAAVVRIDRKLTGRQRTDYFERKFKEVMDESGVRLSLVAEIDATAVGYVMARVDFGEFGMTEPAAVIDTIGVEPGHARSGVGQALLSQLLANLATLRVDSVRTTVLWDNFELLRFLRRRGFVPSQRLVLTRSAG